MAVAYRDSMKPMEQIQVILNVRNNNESIEEGKREPKKDNAGSKKHSDLYTDENPKGTIHGLKFATVKDAEASVNKIKNHERNTHTKYNGSCL